MIKPCIKKILRSVRLWSWVVLALFLLLALLPNIIIPAVSRPHISVSLDRIEPAQCAVILGAAVYRNKRVSPVVYDRIVRGVELYRAGKVDKVLISGDHGTVGYDEVNTMRHWLVKFGVPEQDIFMDHAGFSTYESIYRARDVFRVESAVVVTQNFHLTRAVYLARRKGINAQGYIADRRNYLHGRYYQARDAVARIKDFLWINIFRPKPKYLGDPIPITGDGRITHDQ